LEIANSTLKAFSRDHIDHKVLFVGGSIQGHWSPVDTDRITTAMPRFTPKCTAR